MSEVEGGTGAFWEKQVGESHKAYMAFATYRDMGLTRSLRRAAAIFYAEHGDDQGDHRESEWSPEIGTSGQIARFKRWSRTWMWRPRCEAFDMEQARERSAEYAKRRIEARDQLYMTGKLQLDAAMLKANEMRNNAAEISDKLLPGLTREAVRTISLALDFPTERIETTSARHDEEEQAIVGELEEWEKEELAYNLNAENAAYFESRFEEIERQRDEREGGDLNAPG